MEKISLYGLSGSGKSCYIFAMAQALSQGIRFSDGQILTVRCPEPRQMAQLHKAYQQLENGIWPAGNIESVDYRFNCRLALAKQMDFDIKDYRGGLLNSDDDDEGEQNKLFDSFTGSNVLLFFIGADKIKEALGGDHISVADIDFMNILYERYLDDSHDAKTPVMLVITKSDLLSDSEKDRAKSFIMNMFQSMFGTGTNLTSAITMVTLGRNLSNVSGELEGELIIGPTAGNIQIPILYSLFCVISERIEQSTGQLVSAQDSYSSAQSALKKELNRSAFARFFDSNEQVIRKKISTADNIIGLEKEKLLKLSETLSRIKPILLNGADLYINGVKQ